MARIAYARVSSYGQSLEVQLEKLTTASADRIFSEKQSGRTADARAELQLCLDYVRDGDVLLVTKLDRLARSTRDLLNIANKLEQKKVALVVLDQQIDTSTATGKLLFTMLGAIAEFENDIRRDRQTQGVELAKKNGVVFGRKSALSDAQIAETIISGELKKLGQRVTRVDVAPGTVLKYVAPPFIAFKTPYMQRVLAQLAAFEFVVAEDGYSKAPPEMEEMKIAIGESVYTMGMGGLHSCEKRAMHVADGTFTLVDRDVASYYPAVILTCGIYPEHLGPDFLKVYGSLVDKRLAAKAAKNKVVADSLKITINGTFGKLGSKWSVLYSPNLLFQVTLTGQLGLLMLIEALELASIGVVSANTDGIVSKIPAGLENVAAQVVQDWEKATGFETEAVEYDALYSRDINNYIAVKKGGGTKNKGAYANPWKETPPSIFRMHKNPTTTICIDAVEQYLISKTPVEETIRGCSDIRKFISIRTVKGGAVKDGVYLGKAIRWYYSTEAGGEIVYAISGNRVAKSEGAKPCMTLPDTLPGDIDYLWYETEALKILESLGIEIIKTIPATAHN